MVIFRSNFSVFLSFNTQLTHLNASNLLNFNPSNRFLPIASQSWCSGVSKMATYIYIYRAALYVVRWDITEMYGCLICFYGKFVNSSKLL